MRKPITNKEVAHPPLLLNPAMLPENEELIYKAGFTLGSAKLNLFCQKNSDGVLNLKASAVVKTLSYTLINYTLSSASGRGGTFFYEENDEIRNAVKRWQRENSHFFYEGIKKGQTSSLGSFECHDEFVQDILSSIYALRGQELSVGSHFKIKTFRKEYPINIELFFSDSRQATIAGFGDEERSQLRLHLESPGQKNSATFKLISETTTALWVDQQTGIVTSFEFKPAGLPLVRISLVFRNCGPR